MIPQTVRKILAATTVACGVVFCYWVLRDSAAGVAFGLSSLWAIANLVALSGLVVSSIRPGKRAAGVVAGWMALKVAIWVGGFAMLVAAVPMRPAVGWAILAGISSVLIVTVLTAAGAAIMGIDLLEGRKSTSLVGAQPGGKA
jgi:hypothetical protein